MYLVITSFYAYVFYFGGYLRWNEIKNGDELYTAGSIITIMFATVFGFFTLGVMVPHSKAISEAGIAGKLAYDVIDHIPLVDPNQNEA